MIADEIVFDTLQNLVDGRVYPSIAPSQTEVPYITYTQVGGSSINFLKQEVPSKKNSRFQINVWAKSRIEAVKIANSAETLLRTNVNLQTKVLGAHIAIYEADTKLHGTRQDFSFWV